MKDEKKEKPVTETGNQLKKLEYDENGLVKDIQYYFNEDGGIDWKKMIPVKFLYINNDPKNRAKIEKKYGKSYEEIDIVNDKVEDIDLIQNLNAAKFLLRLRGFTDIQYNIKESNENYASVNCRIVFRGNYESLGEPMPFEDNACAHLNNTNSFGKHYLLETATNRAFTRCIRNALNISIVNKEELFSGSSSENDNSPPTSNLQVELLQKELDKNHITFPQFQAKLIKDNVEGAANMKNLSELPKDKIFEYLERLKAKKINKT